MTQPTYQKVLQTEIPQDVFVGKLWLVHTANCEDGLIRKAIKDHEQVLLEAKGMNKKTKEEFREVKPVREFGYSPTFTGPFERPFEATNYRQWTREQKAS